jgi:hypothetical protein
MKMTRSLRLVPPFAFAFASALASSPSIARADDQAIAQQQFQEGRALMAAGKVAEACPKFAAAAQLSPTTGVRLNLALCYAALGRTASAWVKAHEALALADRTGDAAAAARARDQMSALEPKLSYLTVAVTPAAPPVPVEVTLDGEKLPESVLGTEFPIDPGDHDVTARASGREAWSTKTTVSGAGSHVSVTVPALRSADAVPASGRSAGQPGPAAASEADASSLGTARVLALVSGGLGVAGVAVGTVFGLMAGSKKSDYQQHQANGVCIDPQCASISKDAVGDATASTVAFVAGGALIATGVTLWVLAPRAEAHSNGVAVLPVAGPGCTGASIEGVW